MRAHSISFLSQGPFLAAYAAGEAGSRITPQGRIIFQGAALRDGEPVAESRVNPYTRMSELADRIRSLKEALTDKTLRKTEPVKKLKSDLSDYKSELSTVARTLLTELQVRLESIKQPRLDSVNGKPTLPELRAFRQASQEAMAQREAILSQMASTTQAIGEYKKEFHLQGTGLSNSKEHKEFFVDQEQTRRQKILDRTDRIITRKEAQISKIQATALHGAIRDLSHTFNAKMQDISKHKAQPKDGEGKKTTKVGRLEAALAKNASRLAVIGEAREALAVQHASGNALKAQQTKLADTIQSLGRDYSYGSQRLTAAAATFTEVAASVSKAEHRCEKRAAVLQNRLISATLKDLEKDIATQRKAYETGTISREKFITELTKSQAALATTISGAKTLTISLPPSAIKHAESTALNAGKTLRSLDTLASMVDSPLPTINASPLPSRSTSISGGITSTPSIPTPHGGVLGATTTSLTHTESRRVCKAAGIGSIVQASDPSHSSHATHHQPVPARTSTAIAH